MDLDNSQTDNQLKQKIRLEEIQLLYGGALFAYTATVVISLLAYFVLTGHVTSQTNLVIWLLLMLGIVIARSSESYRFSALEAQQQLESRWRISFFTGAGIAGFWWGMLPWLASSNEVEYIAFITICIVGVMAGSLSTLSYRWEAMALFILPCSLLTTLRLALDDRRFTISTSFLLCIFIIFSLSIGRRTFNNTQQNIRLRLEADQREHSIGLMHQKQALHLQNTPLATIEFDTSLKITEWNKAAEKIFGYTHSEAIGQNIMQLLVADSSIEEAETLWQRLLNREAIAGAIIENMTRSDILICCEWYITPLTDNNNRIVSMAAMALDITEKRHNELAIIRTREEAIKANQAKSDFLSSISHELRTPLHAILGFSQLLAFDKALNDKHQSYVSQISNAGNMLLELIDQILDLARIEKGHLQLTMEQVDLQTLFNECSKMVGPLAEKKNISLHINTGGSGYVLADHKRLKQVILNLLSNAIKYNRDHGTVTLTTRQKENSVVRINITDTGKGITEDLLHDIFKPFYRLNTAVDIEGTGIGLSISKQLLEMMNGKIGVTSKINEGSNFWIEMPGKLETGTINEKKSDASQGDTTLDSSHQTHYSILVAEDNAANQALILRQLETLGYTVDLVNDGNEALNKVLAKNYDLLLTDCNMPQLDGYKLAKSIRQSGNGSIPIIAISADAFPETKAKCINAGMNDHIAKPVELAVLKKTMEMHLAKPE